MASCIQRAISKLVLRENLNDEIINCLLGEIKDGKATDAQIGGFLVALTSKGPTPDEIASIALTMRKLAIPVRPGQPKVIDTCGTGGGLHTYNVSTASSLLSSSVVPVCKHGSRSISGKSGSADVQEALGINIHMTGRGVEEMIKRVNYGFMYAPYYHPIMGRVVKPEFELGIKTIFYTIIGPLISPADIKRHLLGVFKKEYVQPVAEILAKIGYEHALVVHGLDGFDEISITGETLVAEVVNGKVKDTYKITPSELGLPTSPLDRIIENNPPDVNAQIIKRLFNGEEKGPRLDLLLANSAGHLYVGDVVRSLKDGVELAKQIIEEGKAREHLDEVVVSSEEIAAQYPVEQRL